MKNTIYTISLLLIIFITSCEEKKQTQNDVPTVDTSKYNAGSPEATIQSLRDSTDKAWKIMMDSDDQKIKDIERLLQEITYCKKYNALLLDSLTDVLKTFKDKRYNQLTMKSEEIDAYDELTNKVIERTKYLARTTEELKSHPIAETLYNDIAKADNDVALYRAMYDRFAIVYNEYLEANKEALGSAVDKFTKLPLFSLIS